MKIKNIKKTGKAFLLATGLMFSPSVHSFGWDDIDIDSIIDKLSDLTSGADDIFSSFDLNSTLDGIVGDEELLKCLAPSLKIDSLTSGLGGICDSLDISDSLQFDLGDIGNCVMDSQSGVQDAKGGIIDFSKKLKSQCNNLFSGGGSGGGSGSAPTGGGGATSGNTSYTPAYTSSLLVTQGGGEEGGVLSGEGAKIKDQPYAGGVNGQSVFFDEGGIIAKEAVDNPASSTGNAYKKGDLATQMLKEIAYKQTGETDETKIGLPATMGDAMEDSINSAALIATGEINYHDFSSGIVQTLKDEFQDINASTLTEYYKLEKEKWKELVDKNETIAVMRKLEKDSEASVLANDIFLSRTEEGSIYDVSETRARLIPVEGRNDFRIKAMRQIVKNTMLRAKMAIESARKQELFDIALKKTYASASIFRADIAKKEIEAMLNAIDKVIK